jgi:hypothetical protein
MTGEDGMFSRVHRELIADELWVCLLCGGIVCDRDTHRAIHADLDATAAAVTYLSERAGRHRGLGGDLI